MALEIERKFLVQNDSWRNQGAAEHLCQGYLCAGPLCVVRVRLAENKAFLTIKGPTQGIERTEYEYPIPPADARAMLHSMCTQACLEKTRHTLVYKGHTWEIDEFAGANEGLIVAEIELERADQPFERPPWLGREVSHDPRYVNANLVKNPYSAWKAQA